jgi:hypothetical protein
MANTISAAFVEQFRSNVYQLSQQRGSRLGMATRFESLVGNVHNFERLGAVAAQEKVSRHADTPILDAPHSRRRVSPGDYEWGDLVDREDKLRLIISPESEYAIAGANSLGRQKDDLIIKAFTDPATDGAGNDVNFPAGQSITEAGTDGLTLDKVLAGVQLMNAAEVDDMDRYIGFGSQQLTDVLKLAEFTNQDYNTVRTLMSGQVSTFLGLTWIRTERLTPARVNANMRSVIMWQKQSVGQAVNEDMFARIAERADKSFAFQVYCRLTMGATRIEEEGVVEIECYEAP